jgi:hypothetical protein
MNFLKDTQTKVIRLDDDLDDTLGDVNVSRINENDEHIGLDLSDNEDDERDNVERNSYLPDNVPLPESRASSVKSFSPEEEVNKDKEILDKSFMVNYINKFYKEESLEHKMTMDNSYTSIKNEFNRVKVQRESEEGCEFLKNGLMLCFHGMELIDSKVVKSNNLTGYSSYMKMALSNNASVDELLTEIFKKYYDNMPSSPEFKLGMIIAFNTFVFISAKKMTASIPKPEQNPEEPPKMKKPEKSANDILKELDDLSDVSLGEIQVKKQTRRKKKN